MRRVQQGTLAQPADTSPGSRTAASSATTPATEVGASTASYVNEAAAVVQAGAAIVSIWFAARAVKLSLLSNREQRAANEVERRRGYFNRFMLEPATTAISSFRARSVALIGTAERDLTQMGSGVLSLSLESRASAAIEQFNSAYYDLTEELRFADDALGNTSLWPTLERRLQEIQDGVVLALEQMALPTHRDGDAALELVRAGTANLLAEIRTYDLTTHANPATVTSAERGTIRRMRERLAAVIAPRS